MPAENVATTLVRVLEMLRCLPHSGAGMTASELHAKLLEKGYVLEKRTVERDLQMLKEAFDAQIKCNDKSKPFGWSWQKDADFQISGMGVTEALSLQTIGDAIKPLFPASVLASLESRLKQARNTLNELAPRNKHAAWAGKVRSVQPSLPMLPPLIDPGVLTVVQECLLDDLCIKAVYQGAGKSEPLERLLHPLALVQRGPVTYLVATSLGYSEPRIFALHRFHTAENTYEAATIPREFDIDQYIEEGHLHFGNSEITGAEIRFEAKLAPWLMNILKETPLSADQTFIRSGESWRVKASLRNTHQLQWWILAQGPALEVIAPTSLRKRIAKEVFSTLSLYSFNLKAVNER